MAINQAAVAIAWIGPGQLFEHGTPVAWAAAGIAAGAFHARGSAAARTTRPSGKRSRRRRENACHSKHGKNDCASHANGIGQDGGDTPARSSGSPTLCLLYLAARDARLRTCSKRRRYSRALESHDQSCRMT